MFKFEKLTESIVNTHELMYQHKLLALNQTQVGHTVKDCGWQHTASGILTNVQLRRIHACVKTVFSNKIKRCSKVFEFEKNDRKHCEHT